MKTKQTNYATPEEINKAMGEIPRLYSTKAVAKLWGISYYTLRQLVIKGTIKPVVSIAGVTLKGWKFKGDELKPSMLEKL